MSIAAPDLPPEPAAGRAGNTPADGTRSGATRTPSGRPSSSRTAPAGRALELAGAQPVPGTRSLRLAEIGGLCRAVAAEAVRERRMPGEDRLGPLATAAARAAGARVPLSAVLRACQEGLRSALDVAGTVERNHAGTAEGNHAGTGDGRDEDGLPSATDLMLELLRAVTGVVGDAYVDEDRQLAVERRAAGQALASALLSGRPGTAVARHSGLPIAPYYQVVALAAVPSGPPDEQAARGSRGVPAAVAEVLGAETPGLLAHTGGTLLLARVPGEPEFTAELLAELSAAAGSALAATAMVAAAGQVPEAAEQVHELLELARLAGRGPGLHGLDDLAMEYQLTRDGPAGRQLARLLDPLEAHPELFETARAYLRNDMNRRLTARQLFVHPNTVDYRLRRIGRLTGIDLATAAGIAQATAALLARDMDRTGRDRTGRTGDMWDEADARRG